ncbi:hypothetical protein [Adhaeribacter pallidiroseus]|uniref:Uncharacterized protein n=1 Tax=Adhaeribacter pallidiroseus TaxID=2072847 RepID=A0A369Q709_9BACT|nr:hypothetical protein [Adhaeribacter pallidiroseus]RDC58709.1 hypothetical protein AHMF7616_05343 [Adhaeribacter pallidiroseus]
MAKDKKDFGNVLGKLHGNKLDMQVPKQEDSVIIKKSEKVRKRITFFVDERLEHMIDIGTLEEKYRSKSDFVERILMNYFKDKDYIKS